MKRIVELDFIKALAIMMVVIAHTSCPPLVGHINSGGGRPKT